MLWILKAATFYPVSITDRLMFHVRVLSLINMPPCVMMILLYKIYWYYLFLITEKKKKKAEGLA